MATYNNIKKIKIGDNIFNLYDSGNSGGTVTSVAVSNATNGGLSISGSPISTSGTISIGQSNVLTSAQTTQAVYPIKIDKNGHISAYGSAVTIVNTRGTAASGGTTLSVVNTGDMYTWNNKQDKLTNPVTGTGTSGYLVKWNGSTSVTNGPQLGSSTTTFLRNDGNWATPANTDEKVTQTATTTDATYEILFSGTADNTTRTEGTRKTNTLTYNPSTKTLTTTNIVATYLKATDAKITNILEANEVHTNKWTAANIANIGGSFYISPTMESNITGATISVSSNVYTFSVSGGTFSTTAANVNWNTGSRVMATGTITKGGVEYPIGTVIGTLSAISSTGFTINNILSANKGTLDKISAASGSYTAGKVQISMYQIKDGSAYKPVGIYLTSYGADTGEGGTKDTSLDTFIDIYGGTNAIGSNAGMGGADPNVRIGYLSHLDSYTDSAGNTRQPTGWGIYTDNGYFKGVVVADSGSIGHFTINANAIYSGSHSAYNSNDAGIFLGRPSNESSDYYVAGGPNAEWYLKSDGTAKIGAMTLEKVNNVFTLKVPAANITGTLTASQIDVSGVISAGSIVTNTLEGGTFNTTNYIRVSTQASSSLTIGTSGAKTDWRIIAGKTFGVDKSGNLYATSANVTGTITASGGSITGGLTVTGYFTTNASRTTYNSTSATGITIDKNGIGGYGSSSAYFNMTTGGVLTAAGANVLTATIGNATNKITIGTGSSGHSSIRYGMTTLADATNNGFYIGTDGIALGKGVFKVTAAGALTATSATITGAITATSLKIGSGSTDYANDITTISSKASGDAEYSVEIITSNFIPTATGNNTLITLTARVTKLGSTNNIGTINYQWYGDNDSLGTTARSATYNVPANATYTTYRVEIS